jgi:hypothetical protein
VGTIGGRALVLLLEKGALLKGGGAYWRGCLLEKGALLEPIVDVELSITTLCCVVVLYVVALHIALELFSHFPSSHNLEGVQVSLPFQSQSGGSSRVEVLRYFGVVGVNWQYRILSTSRNQLP